MKPLSDVWIEDCSIAAIIVHLAAESLGLGSCWIQVRNRQHNAETTSEDYVRDVLGIGHPLGSWPSSPSESPMRSRRAIPPKSSITEKSSPERIVSVKPGHRRIAGQLAGEDEEREAAEPDLEDAARQAERDRRRPGATKKRRDQTP